MGNILIGTKYMSQKKERIAWIDSAKGILMILVILGHSLAETSIKSRYYHGYILAFRCISIFHMPAFFILSGYLMGCHRDCKEISVSRFIKRKFIKLMLPYFIFEGVAIVLLVYVLRFKNLKQALIDTFIVNDKINFT